MAEFILFVILSTTGGFTSDAITHDQLLPEVKVEHVYKFNQ